MGDACGSSANLYESKQRRGKLIKKLISKDVSAVIACSALKRVYREYLQDDNEAVRFVYLKGDYELIRERMEGRSSHFMKADLLLSQFAALQEPEGVITVNISRDPEEIVKSIIAELRRA